MHWWWPFYFLLQYDWFFPPEHFWASNSSFETWADFFLFPSEKKKPKHHWESPTLRRSFQSLIKILFTILCVRVCCIVFYTYLQRPQQWLPYSTMYRNYMSFSLFTWRRRSFRKVVDKSLERRAFHTFLSYKILQTKYVHLHGKRFAHFSHKSRPR